MLQKSDAIVREINDAKDKAALSAFLAPKESLRLEQLRPALENADAVILVIEKEQCVFGWVVLHLRLCRNINWTIDADTVWFQSGENAYLEHIEIEQTKRGHGYGQKLLAAAEALAQQKNKTSLWLHTSEANATARRFYTQAGWVFEKTVITDWSDQAAMCVYQKKIAVRND
jgi:GNAT superfamily N-acetyltransferase